MSKPDRSLPGRTRKSPEVIYIVRGQEGASSREAQRRGTLIRELFEKVDEILKTPLVKRDR